MLTRSQSVNGKSNVVVTLITTMAEANSATNFEAGESNGSSSNIPAAITLANQTTNLIDIM